MKNEILNLLQKMNEYGALSYSWILFISFWGGIVRYLSSLNGEKPTAFGCLIDLISSGFVGVITASICIHFDIGFYITSALTGVMAHNGTMSLRLLMVLIKKHIKG